MENNFWEEMTLKVANKRLWHQSVSIDSDWIVIGGVRTNIHNNHQDSIVYKNFVCLLTRASIEVIMFHRLFTPKTWYQYLSHLRLFSGLLKQNELHMYE